MTNGSKVYSKTFVHEQGYDEVLNFDGRDRTDTGHLSSISSTAKNWFKTSSHTELYTGSNLLPSGTSGLNLTITKNGRTVSQIVDAGTNTVKASPQDGYKWSGTVSKDGWEKTVTIKVEKRTVDVKLTSAQTLTYNGKERKGYTLSGDISYVIFTEYRSFLSA